MAPQKNPASKEANSPSAVPGGPPQGNVINLMALAPQQLAQLKQQVEQELQFYQDAILQLKDVQLKMQESNNCVKNLNPEKKEMLVPVTGSVNIFKICVKCKWIICNWIFYLSTVTEIFGRSGNIHCLW